MTIGKRMAAKLKDIRAKLRMRMHERVRGTVQWLQQVVRGYFHYHAIPGNWARMSAFRKEVLHLWYQALRRRSQRSRLTRERFHQRLGVLLPSVQILQPYPTCASTPSIPISEVRTVCVSSASTGLCGGQWVNRCPYRDHFNARS
jgi:hypothetical protein